MSPKEFVQKYKGYAEETQQKTGISAKFILAQAALETGWAKSVPGNMFFGVKAQRSTPDNKRQLITTREVLDYPTNTNFPEIISVTKRADGKYDYRVKDWFMKYSSPEESFTDHANFFIRNKRYAKALEVRDHAYLFADAIAKAGYATVPNYAETLKSVIKTIERNY